VLDFDLSFRSALENLAKKYDILGEPIDLSLFYDQDGGNIIFEALKSLYRPVFENRQRIVVIQPNRDQYSYAEHMASDAVIFLQQSLQKIDISNFFIVMVTGNKNIHNELEWLQKKFSTDQAPIGSYIVDTEFTKIHKNRDTFCAKMWSHLYVNTQLEILPCCIARPDLPLGSLEKNTVDEIINSEHAKSMRLKMLANESCVECEVCYKKEDDIGTSSRIRENREFQDKIPELIALTKPDGSLEKFNPISTDIRLNNICNLKCRTCDGLSSSQLAVEEKNLFNNVENFKKIPTTKTREHVLSSIIDYFQSVKRIYFAGGEPLILKEHYDILDYLISINKTNVPIYYSTNFTNLAFKDKNVLEYWKKFENVTIGASLDGHGEILQYVRHGTNWQDIEKNLRNLKSQCPHVKFTVTSTVSMLSAESIIELQQMWHNKGTLSIDMFKINVMLNSDYLSLQSLSIINKEKFSKKIDDHCNWLESKNAFELVKDWQKIKDFMWAKNKFYINQNYAKVNRARDLARGENFEKMYPHLADMFSPYYEDKI
jgi:MoaA/NifB/PqqE/SkfB family radical SAM enzyme